MSFVLPNPSTPQNGQTGYAIPILENFQALAQAIASFDGSQVQAKSIIEAALADSINTRLRGLETLANFVYTGCIWSSVSGLNGTMTGGTIYVNGYRTIVSGVGSNSFSASSDTYVDIDYLGNVTYLAVGNNITAPALTANAIRVAKIVTNGSSITTISQAQSADGVGNIIYPLGPVSPVKTQNPYKFSVYRNAALTPVSTAVLTCDTKEYDSGNNVDIVTNLGRFTVPSGGAGLYHFNAQATTGNNRCLIMLYKNGSEWKRGSDGGANAAASNVGILSTDAQGVAGDYFEIYINTSSAALSVGNRAFNYFQGRMVSAS